MTTRLLRVPLSMWAYGVAGAGLIVWSGLKIVIGSAARRRAD